MLATDAIKLPGKQWAPLTVLILKEDESIRFCFDYCKQDAVKILDYYTVFVMDECI